MGNDTKGGAPAMHVKICGLTSAEDARGAVAAGANAIGFVFAESSRRVTVEQAREMSRGLSPFVVKVGVFVNAPLEVIRHTARTVPLQVIQLHGQEDNSFIERVRELGYPVVKAVAVRDESVVDELVSIRADGLLLDTYDPNLAGGTGATFDWRLAVMAKARLREAGRDVPVTLAGGLNPANVGRAVMFVGPDAVDVSSGVELAPGKKSREKMIQFVEKARQRHGDDETARGG